MDTLLATFFEESIQNQWNLHQQRAVLLQVPRVLPAPWRKRNDRVRRRRRPRGTGARSTSRLHTRPPAAPCSPSPGCAAPLGRSHADAGDGGGAGAGAAAAPARQPCGRRASIDAFTVARDGTPLPRAALGAKVEPVWAIEIFFGPFHNFPPCSMALQACMQIFKPSS